MNLYPEILNSSPEDLYQEEYYSIPLQLKDLLKVYQVLQNEDVELANQVSTFLIEEYDLDLNFITSLFK
jgi:hypothetical protein